MVLAARETTTTSPFDVYGNTDRLDSPILEVMATRLEARYARPEFQRMMVEYLEAMQIDQAESVLDLGCGTGVVARYVASRPVFKGRVTAIDLSSHLVETGQRIATEQGLDGRIDFRPGDSRNLELPDNCFDAVVAHTLISHVDDLATVLDEIARVTRPGGFIGIFDGDYASLTFSNPDPQQGKIYDELVVSGLITNPRVMRRLPELLATVELDIVQHFGYVESDVGRADYWASFLESLRKLLPASGAISVDEADRWVEERFAESDRGTFFGSCNYYTYVARKA